MAVDLHTHSTASDGTLPAAQVVRLAARLPLNAVAISDHDSVGGITEALAEGQRLHLTVVPAAEFSALEGETSIHVLGYFIDHTHPALLTQLAALRDARVVRAEHIVGLLAADGFSVDFDDLLRATDGGSLGRSHIAAALVRAGYAHGLSDAFKRFVGREAPYFVAKSPVSVQEIVRIIHDAGGLAVVAHPGISGVDGLLGAMVAAGIDGIEALHAEHTHAQRVFYSRMAAQHGLLVTGGSDFHGPHMAGRPLGAGNVPDEILYRLADAAGLSAPACLRGLL